MPGIEEEDSSMLPDEKENLSRDGSTIQGKHNVGGLAEASCSLAGNSLGREEEPLLLFNATHRVTTSLPFAVDSHCKEERDHTHNLRLSPIPILNRQRPTEATNAKVLVETEILRFNRTVSVEKDPG